MNLVEFLFAFFAVFGFSGFWLLWTKFVYSLEEKPGSKEVIEVNPMHKLLRKIAAFFRWLQQAGKEQRKRLITRGARDRKDDDATGVD